MKERPTSRGKKTVLKGELVERIFHDVGVPIKPDAAHAVDVILKTMTEALAKGQRIEIRGFGSLSVRKRQAKVTTNPKTGAIMAIPARNTLHFTMSKSLKEPLIEKKDDESMRP